jgi:hypothetical protein
MLAGQIPVQFHRVEPGELEDQKRVLVVILTPSEGGKLSFNDHEVPDHHKQHKQEISAKALTRSASTPSRQLLGRNLR